MGRVPRGLYVLRDDATSNIRIYSGGRQWLHLVTYEDDRKDIGTIQVEEFLEEVGKIREDLDDLMKKSSAQGEEISGLGRRLELLERESRLMSERIMGPERDSRMFTLRCWGKNGKCRCQVPEPVRNPNTNGSVEC
ncbi:MAG: hypothetical protein KIS29_09885 [Thermoplasmata archaeon]|nr:hypothetical protein [Candidatus Sysuiplasma jiujiangense]